MEAESKIYAALTKCVGWVGRNWYKVRVSLMLAWIGLSISQWIFLRVTSEWFIGLYWLTNELARTAGTALIIFLLLENWIVRIQIRKQDAVKH